ncbi:MAG: alpha/beta fold hydrolase [Nitrososphaeria archaeon]|nr:alpha/beta fold hydrolase [Nitrososphaeria archaeon]
MKKPNLILIATISIIIVLLNVYLLKVNEAFNVYEGNLDGGRIYYRTYLPKNMKEGTLVILIHGFGGSSEMMNMIGYALADNGIFTIAYDVPGHGKSLGSLYENISEAYGDFLKVVDKAKEFGVKASSIAIVGHSMGAGYEQILAKNDSRIKCIILLGAYPNSQVLNKDDRINLLVLNGENDELVNVKRCLKSFENVTGLENAVVGRMYGSFEKGDAREFYVSGLNDHLTILYSNESVEKVVDWVTKFYCIGKEKIFTLQRLAAYILVSIFTFTILLPASKIISAKLPEPYDIEKKIEARPTLIYFVTTFLVSPSTVIVQTIFYATVPLFILDFVLAFFYTQIISFIATLYFYKKFFSIGFRELYKKFFRTDKLVNRIILSLTLFTLTYFAYILMFQNFLNIELSLHRLNFFLYAIVLILPYTFFNELFYRGLTSLLDKGNMIQTAFQIALRVVSAILFYIPIGILLGFSTGMAGYLLIVMYMLIILQVSLDLISSTIFIKTRSITEQVIWTALIYSAILTSISPLI